MTRTQASKIEAFNNVCADLGFPEPITFTYGHGTAALYRHAAARRQALNTQAIPIVFAILPLPRPRSIHCSIPYAGDRTDRTRPIGSTSLRSRVHASTWLVINVRLLTLFTMP